MNEEQDLKTIEQESFRELMQDGFTEIMAGIIFLVFPLLITEPGFIPIFLVFFIIFLPQFVEVVRKKYVYPRIGYVKLREDEPPKVTAGIVITVILMIAGAIILIYSIATGIISSDLVYRCVPAFFGLIMLAPSVYLKDKTGQNRYYLPGALMSITGVTVSLAAFISVDIAIVIYTVGWGTAFFVLGVIRLVRFILKHPPIDTPEAVDGEQ